MSQPGIEGLAIGLNKGHRVTKNEGKPKHTRRPRTASKKVKVSTSVK